MTYTYRNPAAGPDSISISPLRGGDGPAWPSTPARGLTCDLYLQDSDSTCLSFEDSLQRLLIPYRNSSVTEIQLIGILYWPRTDETYAYRNLLFELFNFL